MFTNGGGGANKGGQYSRLPTNHDRSRYSDDSSDDSDMEDDFIRNQIRSQKQQFKEQDRGLEMLSQSADRLGQLSMNISEELGNQNKMLDDMEADLDKAATNLDIVTAKTRELIKRSGGKKYFLIIVTLTLVVIVLFFLVIYT